MKLSFARFCLTSVFANVVEQGGLLAELGIPAGQESCLCAAVIYLSCISRPLTGMASDSRYQHDLKLLLNKDKKKYMG